MFTKSEAKQKAKHSRKLRADMRKRSKTNITLRIIKKYQQDFAKANSAARLEKKPLFSSDTGE